MLFEAFTHSANDDQVRQEAHIFRRYLLAGQSFPPGRQRNEPVALRVAVDLALLADVLAQKSTFICIFPHSSDSRIHHERKLQRKDFSELVDEAEYESLERLAQYSPPGCESSPFPAPVSVARCHAC